jgi:ABC-2 type transport system ATP-binding protein
MKAIETKKLTKKFKEFTAVNELDLDIEQGELFALLGVNGAGKTTTIKMLSGILIPTSGDALMLGKSITKQADEVREFINVSPQETAVAPNLSVKENLQLIAEIYGIEKSLAKQKTEELINSFNLTEVENKKSKLLSGGMQRRLSIAMALITDPKILFLDEPTLGLDVIARRELWSAITKLKGRVTVILTTHYMEEAESLSDRIGIMSKGSLKRIGTASELIQSTDSKNFEEAFIKIVAEGVLQ